MGTSMKMILKQLILTTGLISGTCAYAGEFTPLGSLDSYSVALGVNNAGVVVGYSYSNTSPQIPTLWNGTSMQSLLTDGALGGVANAINDHNQIAGTLGYGLFDSKAVKWDNGVASLLSVNGSTITYGMDINNSGQVVGGSFNGSNLQAIVWNATSPTMLDTPQGHDSIAYGVNNSGQIAGMAYSDYVGSNYATTWKGNEFQDLSVPNRITSATDVNDAGVIVGNSDPTVSKLPTQAAIWDGTKFTELGILQGGKDSFAGAINNLNQVVGYGHDETNRAFALLWDEGQLYNLNDFLDADAKSQGWVLVTASDISDTGWVVGMSQNVYTGVYRGYLLSIDGGPVNGGPIPIPEPETNAMLIAGLGFLAFIGRRRAKAPIA